MTNADTPNVFACRCLNVRIRTQSDMTESGNDSEYKSVYVADEGVTIAHPQVTLRTRSGGVPVPNTERCTRYVTLSCLICQTIVYRVSQNMPMDIEGKEGPLLPTDDWAEQDILKSASGWIELHNGCLDGEAITTAEKSSSYSTIFSVVLPSPSLPPSESNSEPSYIPPSPSPLTHTPGSYLPNLRPIFPPPPFTPSHPVFVHLSSLARSNSEALRTDAEAYLAELVKEKVAEIEKTETELRRHVEALWRTFREGVEKVAWEGSARAAGNGVEVASSKPSPALVTVREFNPVPTPRRAVSPTFTPRMSSLSASLATSSFHHPKAQVDQGKNSLSHEVSMTSESPRLSPQYLSDPSSSLSSKDYSSLSSRSSKSMSIRASVDGPTYLEPFRRNMDQSNDTATSFRYFTILEADTARTRQKTGTQRDAGQDMVAKPDNEVTREVEKSINGNKMEKPNGSSSRSRKTISKSDDRKTKNEVNEMSPQGKRKVTFDVKPEVVTIEREVDAEKNEDDTERAGRAPEEMIFDLEDEGSGRGISASSASSPLLQLNSAPNIPLRPSRPRVAGAGLPSSFSSLRPASLPAPSVARPLRVLETHKVTSQGLESSPRRHAKRTKFMSDDADSEDSEPLDPRQAEILKLVAADTPSHRGAWKQDSRAWQLFVRRQGDKGHQSGSLIPEETEDDTFGKYADNGFDGDSDPDFHTDSGWAPYKPTNIAASLPLSIGPLSQPKELSLASYQPKTSLCDQPDTLVSALQPRSKLVSSAAWRKAAYAQRDRNRSTDPGPLDFAADEDDDEDDEDESERLSANQDGRGRQRALRILQVRSEVPASGMWRSLA